VKRQDAPRTQLDNRTLWEAIRAADGNVPMAARTLGITTRALLLQLADSRGITWRRPNHSVSGTRRRDELPARESEDELAWGDEDAE
jgi:hypothetical protein